MSSFLQKNFFELFDLPLQFEVDTSLLRSRFRDLQKAVHPDKFAAESAQSQRLAVQYAAHANQGFQTLKDPVQRGLYLLSLFGYQVQTDSSTIQDTEFLMQQMMLRERLETAEANELEELLNEVEGELASLECQVAALFHAQDLKVCEVSIKKMQFYRRLLEEIEERI